MWRVLFANVWILCAALSAQKTAWRIPPLGAVEYSRECSADASRPARSRGDAARAPLDGKLPGRYLPRLPPAPWLCQPELRGDQRAVEGPIGDVRDALRALAFDLAQDRAARLQVGRLIPFGDVTARGRWSPRDEQGRQTFTGDVTARPPLRIGREDRAVAERLALLCVHGAKGSLELERAVDESRGLVVSFAARCDLVVEEGDKAFRRVVIEDRWQLVAVRENQDFDFRKRVMQAIRDGAGWVREQVQQDESYLRDKRGERNYGSGRLALALLTMLHGYVPADDDVLVRGFQRLLRARIDDAYSLATALLAIDAWHRRAPLDDRGRKVADKWLRELLKCVDPRVEPDELLRFNYTAGPRFDTSLQQYGLLGLRAAQRLELSLPDTAFAAAARHLLDVQTHSEGSATLLWCDHGQVQAALGGDDPPDAHKGRARLRGFAYQHPEEPPFGSMTSAGVSALLLARQGMLAQRHTDRALLQRIDGAIDDGFAWLGANFSVRVNPGFAERADNHWAYWLYCLERCCELRGVARLQGRDWYHEGGVQLLAAQNPNGSFRGRHDSTLLLDSTCFAVLFLAKASASGPITGGGSDK